MTFKAGEKLLLVNEKGEILAVTSKSDEFRGRIDIESVEGNPLGETSIIHLCRTMRAATIVSNNRKVMHGAV